jgi:hypothetical protein
MQKRASASDGVGRIGPAIMAPAGIGAMPWPDFPQSIAQDFTRFSRVRRHSRLLFRLRL